MNLYAVLANLALAVHGVFILYCVFGGVLVLSRHWTVAVHIPALMWGAATEFFGLICPLTHLENKWLQLAGASGYEGDFIHHYLLAAIYPAGLTRDHQLLLGVLLISFNFLVYWFVYRRRCG